MPNDTDHRPFDYRSRQIDYCPDCDCVVDEINLSINVSFRAASTRSEPIQYTGDTDYGDDLQPVGYVCPDCSREWLVDSWLRHALDELRLSSHLSLTIDRGLLASQRQALEDSTIDPEAKEGLLNLLDAL